MRTEEALTEIQSTEMNDFRLFLKKRLIEKIKANPAYSLRSFARFLRIEPSALSKILNAKRGISDRMFERFADRLNLSPTEREVFRTHFNLKISKPTSRAKLASKRASYRLLSEDSFHLISDWYHYAILELTHLKDFKSDAKWIARRLRISKAEAEAAIERLFRLNFLETKDSRWIEKAGSVTTDGHSWTTSAFKLLQRQILEKSLTALEELDVEERDHSSMTMAVPHSAMALAKKLIREFRRDLCERLQSLGAAEQVVHLQISIYPVTHSFNSTAVSKNSRRKR